MTTILMYLIIGLAYSALIFGFALGFDILIGTFGTDESIVAEVYDYGKSIPKTILKLLFVASIWPLSMIRLAMTLITDCLNKNKGL